MDTIGKRAADAVRRMSGIHDTTLKAELELLGACYSTLQYWEHHDTSPGGYILANMLRRGYDINFILLGKEKLYVTD